MYAIYLLIIIFIGLILYQIINKYSIKEGNTPDQSINAIPYYVNSSGQQIGDPNIDTGFSPLDGLTKWFNENIPAAKYNYLFKGNQYRYVDLKWKYEVMFKPIFGEGSSFKNLQFKKFINLDNDILIWIMNKDTNFKNIINYYNIDKFVELTNAQIRLLIFGTNDLQIKAIMEQPITMIIQILSIPLESRTLLLRLSGPDMTKIFNIPNSYNSAIYVMNKPSSQSLTTIIEKIKAITKMSNDYDICKTNLVKCNADFNISKNDLLQCKIIKSSAQIDSDKCNKFTSDMSKIN